MGFKLLRMISAFTIVAALAMGAQAENVPPTDAKPDAKQAAKPDAKQAAKPDAKQAAKPGGKPDVKPDAPEWERVNIGGSKLSLLTPGPFVRGSIKLPFFAIIIIRDVNTYKHKSAAVDVVVNELAYRSWWKPSIDRTINGTLKTLRDKEDVSNIRHVAVPKWVSGRKGVLIKLTYDSVSKRKPVFMYILFVLEEGTVWNITTTSLMENALAMNNSLKVIESVKLDD